jgi:phosphoserine phosphatase
MVFNAKVCMLEVLLIRPGATTFDEDGRIKGSLDIPLSPQGIQQAEAAAKSLVGMKIDCLYAAPCESAQDTARYIARRTGWKHKTLECLLNVDHGLWQGKLVEEVRRLQPRVYRQFQEHPESVCPPGGETLSAASARVESVLDKLKRKHAGHRFGIVVPEPMASIVRCHFLGGTMGDMWKSETDAGTWDLLVVDPAVAPSLVPTRSAAVAFT